MTNAIEFADTAFDDSSLVCAGVGRRFSFAAGLAETAVGEELLPGAEVLDRSGAEVPGRHPDGTSACW